MLVYVWARRNPYIRMNFFGLLTFNAPYLPWVLLGFSLLLGNSVSVDLLGMAVGHCYYFLEDIFPNQPGGWKILKTPQFLKNLCDPAPEVRGAGQSRFIVFSFNVTLGPSIQSCARRETRRISVGAESRE